LGAFFQKYKKVKQWSYKMKNLANLEILSTRTGFNSAVRHIKKTLGIIDTLGKNTNLGDVLFEIKDEELTGERVGLLLRMVLIDKLGYVTVSSNLDSVVPKPDLLAAEFEKWKAVDLVAVYHHPDMGLLAANPKVAEELANFGALRKRELLVIYAGKSGDPVDETCKKAAELAAILFEGAKPKISPELYKGNFTAKTIKKSGEPKPAQKRIETPKALSNAAVSTKPKTNGEKETVPAKSLRVTTPAVTAASPAISKGLMRMTPMYSVVVQNELFHNGNVEAWKRIIASYNAKYPDLQVYIYYEGERILDINALFKWGKVKHGSSIQFAVAGNEIKDVAKLQRYLVQGASNQFEAFLRSPVSTVMKLF
jgi:hypothetical protein